MLWLRAAIGWQCRCVNADSKIYAQVAQKLRTARRRAGWSQEQLAEGLGIDAVTVSRYETGKHPTPLHIAVKAAGLLAVKPAHFIEVDKDVDTGSQGAKVAPRPRGPRESEATEMLAVWRKLQPRDRVTLVMVAKAMAKRRRT